MAAGAENLALHTEVKGLRELVDLYRERLTDADWRYQELLGQLKTMTKALPAAQVAAPRPKRRSGDPSYLIIIEGSSYRERQGAPLGGSGGRRLPFRLQWGHRLSAMETA